MGRSLFLILSIWMIPNLVFSQEYNMNIAFRDGHTSSIRTSAVDSIYFSLQSSENTGEENPNGVGTNYMGDDIRIFNNILTIGDSMTDGTFNTKDGYYIDAKYSWPSYLRKITGCNVRNWGRSGRSTKGWYEWFNDSIWGGYDCAIIQLGINDYYQKQQDLTQEFLGKIVDRLLQDNPGIKIFVSTIVKAKWYPASQFDPISDNIRQFVNSRSDCYLVDMAKYGHTMDEDAYNAGHFSAYGHWQQAHDYVAYISSIIRNNPQDFINVQFIGTDKTPFISNP